MAYQLPATLCPIYKEAFSEMLASLESAETDEEKIEILTIFSDKYLMIPEYWGLLIDLSEQVHGYSVKENLKNKGRSHFYSLDAWQQAPMYFIYNFHLKWNYTSYLELNMGKSEPKQYARLTNDLKELLTFPHHNLEFSFDMLKSCGPSPPSPEIKQQYEKSKKLYEKFLEAGDDDEKWLECLKEVEVDKAVIDNIELRLGQGQHYANQQIWKYYINFLKSRNSGGLMNVYDRYCRLFISDNEAREEYEKLKNSEVTVPEVPQSQRRKWWRFWRTFSIPKFLKRKEKKPKKIYFKNCEKAVNQTMPFQSPLMHYITENAKAPVLHKLHKSCKYFFNQRPYPVCHRLILSTRAHIPARPLYYIEQSLFVHPDIFYSSNLQNIYVSTLLDIEYFENKDAQKCLSSKLYKWEASCIHVESSNLNIKDFEFFIKSGAIKYMILHDSNIIKANGDSLKEDEARELLVSYGNKTGRFLLR